MVSYQNHRANMANHANNDTKCTPGSRRGAFYYARGAFLEGGVHFRGVGCIAVNLSPFEVHIEAVGSDRYCCS